MALGGLNTLEVGPDLLKVDLREAVADVSLSQQQAHELQMLFRTQRPVLRSAGQGGDRGVQLVVPILLSGGQGHRHHDVASGRELLENLLADPAEKAAGKPGTQSVEVASPADPPPGGILLMLEVPGGKPPLGNQGVIINPVEQRRELLEAVLQGCSSEDETVPWGRGSKTTSATPTLPEHGAWRVKPWGRVGCATPSITNQIGGFSQQQGIGGSILLSSQHGVVNLGTLLLLVRPVSPPRPCSRFGAGNWVLP